MESVDLVSSWATHGAPTEITQAARALSTRDRASFANRRISSPRTSRSTRPSLFCEPRWEVRRSCPARVATAMPRRAIHRERARIGAAVEADVGMWGARNSLPVLIMRRAARCGQARLTGVVPSCRRGAMGTLGSGSGPVLVVVPQRARAAHRRPTTRTNHGDLVACVAHGLRRESGDRRRRA